MLGHNVPDEFIKLLENNPKVYLSQEEGKIILHKDDLPKIAVLIKKEDKDIHGLSLEERAEINFEKILGVTVGSSKNLSEVFIPDKYFENSLLIGRPFLHGLFDCYTLIRDYYKKEFNVYLPTNMQRNWEWWLQGDNLYLDSAKYYGFEEVRELKIHDVIIMKVASPVPNHGAIYIGDNKILHHMAGRFSTIQKLTSSLKQKISVIYRLKHVDNGTMGG